MQIANQNLLALCCQFDVKLIEDESYLHGYQFSFVLNQSWYSVINEHNTEEHQKSNAEQNYNQDDIFAKVLSALSNAKYI